MDHTDTMLEGSPETMANQDDTPLLAEWAMDARRVDFSTIPPTSGHRHGLHISELDRLCRAIGQAELPQFSYKLRSVLTNSPTKEFLTWASTLEDAVEEYSRYQVSPIIDFARRLNYAYIRLHCRGDEYEPNENRAKFIANRRNRVARAAKAQLANTALRDSQKNFERTARENFKELTNKIDRLALSHDVVVALRFDLHDLENGIQGKVTDEDYVASFLRFRSDTKKHRELLKKRFKDDLLGLTWALEYGHERGFHMHYLVFVKPAGNEDHVYAVEQIGQEWEAITGGRGSCYNGNKECNARFMRYRASGRIQFNDRKAIEGLRFIAAYFTLAGLYIKLQVNGRSQKTFQQSGFADGARKKSRLPPRPADLQVSMPLKMARADYFKYI